MTNWPKGGGGMLIESTLQRCESPSRGLAAGDPAHHAVLSKAAERELWLLARRSLIFSTTSVNRPAAATAVMPHASPFSSPSADAPHNPPRNGSQNGSRNGSRRSRPRFDPELAQRLYRIRSFCQGDAEACRQLYTDGLLGGQLAGNDTGLDIDDIAGAYLADPLSHFWVAETTEAAREHPDILGEAAKPGVIVGMIGVQHHDENVGEIRRLRVHRGHRRRRVGSRLLETAIKFCRDSGSLKVQLDTYIHRQAAMLLFDRFHFRHGRTRQCRGKDMLYFYLDLYSQDCDKRE